MANNDQKVIDAYQAQKPRVTLVLPFLFGADRKQQEKDWVRQHVSDGLAFSDKRSRPTSVLVVEITRRYPGTLAKDTLTFVTEHIREAILDGLGVPANETEVFWILNQGRSTRKEVVICAWF